MTEDSLSQSIRRQRAILAEMFKTAFQSLATTCAVVWGSRDKLNEILSVTLQNDAKLQVSVRNESKGSTDQRQH